MYQVINVFRIFYSNQGVQQKWFCFLSVISYRFCEKPRRPTENCDIFTTRDIECQADIYVNEYGSFKNF